MLEIGCSTLAPMGCEFLPQWWGLRPTAYSTLEYFRDAVKVVNRQCKVESISFAIPSADF